MNQNRKKITDQYRRSAMQGGLTSASREDVAQGARLRGYSADQVEGVPEEAVQMGLGCGNPVAIAELQPGEVVLDLGSGGGLDVFVAAKQVGPAGKAIGLDLTAEMVEKARRLATKGGYRNVEFHVGQIENMPVASESIDVVISNCVINHCSDKAAVFREVRRVLKRGGRLYISDLVVAAPMSDNEASGMEIWTDWLKVASGKDEYLQAMEQAGFANVAITVEQAYTGPGMIPALAGRIIRLQLTARK
jgi:arsenite methyltransferase